MAATTGIFAKPLRLLAQQALSRAAGAPLLGGNALELLIDAAAHFDAWLSLIRGAQRRVLLENYIIRDDEVGSAFRDALVERARAGVLVAVVVDWSDASASRAARFGTHCAMPVVRYGYSIRRGWVNRWAG